MAVDSVSDTMKTYENVVSSTVQERKTGEMGKDQFLNLLVTQLKYQDPLKPMEDKEFISQMAQFSSLEQMKNMNDGFQSTKAFSMIGKYIEADTVDDATKEPKVVKGIVDSVKMASGKAYVVVKGVEVPVEEVSNVYDASKVDDVAKLSEYAGLMDKNIKGSAYDPKTGDIIDVSGNVYGLEKGTNEDYAIIDGVNAELYDINGDVRYPDFESKKAYLDENAAKDGNSGKAVDVTIINRSTGKKVPVKAILNAVTYDGYKINVVLDKVAIPVESIYGLNK